MEKCNKCNKELRERMKSLGVRQWELAHAIGISEPTLTRWLRFPLAGERLALVETALNRMEKREV